MAIFDATPIFINKEIPIGLNYNLELNYEFLDRKILENSYGYVDINQRSNFPTLNGTLKDVNIDERCNDVDLDSFLTEVKQGRKIFLFKDPFNHEIKPNNTDLIQSYTTVKLISSQDGVYVYSIFQVFTYGVDSVKKPIYYFDLESIKVNNTNVTFVSVMGEGSFTCFQNLDPLTCELHGTYYTSVRLSSDSKETETRVKHKRTIGDIRIVEYPIFKHVNLVPISVYWELNPKIAEFVSIFYINYDCYFSSATAPPTTIYT